VFDSLIVNIDEMANFLFPELTLGILRIGCLEEWSSKDLINFMHIMIVWLIKGI
jgi:hypothetical protein